MEGRALERAYLKSVQSCSTCSGTGHIRVEGKLKECVCRKRFSDWEKYIGVGIPELYWDKNWSDYTVPPADILALCQQYVERVVEMYKRGVGLYLWGDFGVGKSGLAVEILKGILRIPDNPYTVSFAFFPDVMRDLTSFDTVRPEDRAETERKLIDSDFLVLDDIGREYRREGSSWVGSNIDAYFRKRMNASLPTLMTSNFSLSKVKDLYGDSIASIFRGSLVELNVSGEDFRTLEGEGKKKLLGG